MDGLTKNAISITVKEYQNIGSQGWEDTNHQNLKKFKMSDSTKKAVSVTIKDWAKLDP